MGNGKGCVLERPLGLGKALQRVRGWGKGSGARYRCDFSDSILSSFGFRANHHRRAATPAQTASTIPNGQAPCRKPYAEPIKHEAAKARTNHGLRFSKV